MLNILNIKKLFFNNTKNNANKSDEFNDENENDNYHSDDQRYIHNDDDDGDKDSGINFEDELPFNEMQLKVKELKHILYVLEKNKLIKDKQREALK